MTLVHFFFSDSDSGVSLHSDWCLELVNRPRDTKGKNQANPKCSVWQSSIILKTERLQVVLP